MDEQDSSILYLLAISTILKATLALLVVSYVFFAQAQATETNEGSPIATVNELFDVPSLPPIDIESSLSGQIWGLLYVQPVPSIAIPTPLAPSVEWYNPCSCVSFVKAKRPDQDEPWGSPNNVEAYDITPFKGLIVITTEGAVGHAAYISSVSEDSLFVTEANFTSCRVTTRTIPRDAEYVRGFR